MIAKSVKSMDFTYFVDFDADFDVDFADFTDFGLKLVKLTISFHSTVRIQGGNIKFFLKICEFHGNLQNSWILPKCAVFHKIRRFPTFLSQPSRRQHLNKGILCETKDHLPKKVTPIFYLLDYVSRRYEKFDRKITVHSK